MSADRVKNLIHDPGVLSPEPLLEVYGWRGLCGWEGLAVVPRRDEWLEAMAEGVEAVGLVDGISEGPFLQAVVHLQKGRAATQEGLASAWKHLDPGGRLLLVGGNDLGIKSASRRLGGELGQRPSVLVNRARGRVVEFTRTEGDGPEAPTAVEVGVDTVEPFSLHSAAGVFSADRVDRGSRLLLEHLSAVVEPGSILDMGCGIGTLGLAALRRWPRARAVLADVDKRAVEAAGRNARRLGVDDRCRVAWWDAMREPPPQEGSDLVLINPPFHTGKAVDLDPARAMFRALETALSPGGSALIVANRTLPYERQLDRVGRLRQVAAEAGFKLLRLERGQPAVSE